MLRRPFIDVPMSRLAVWSSRFGWFALAVAANWGPQIAMALGAGRVAAPGLAGAAALMWGNRNAGMYLAALPPDPVFGLYVAFYQLPMLFTPLVLGRILRGRRGAIGS